MLDEFLSLVRLWKDGSIPKKHKAQIIKAFNERFGFKRNDTWVNRMNAGKLPDDPHEFEFMKTHIPEAWNYHNSTQVAA